MDRERHEPWHDTRADGVKVVGYLVLDEENYPTTEDLFTTLREAREHAHEDGYVARRRTVAQVRAMEVVETGPKALPGDRAGGDGS